MFLYCDVGGGGGVFSGGQQRGMYELLEDVLILMGSLCSYWRKAAWKWIF